MRSFGFHWGKISIQHLPETGLVLPALAVTDVSHISGDLEGKVKWLDNFQKFRQLQEVIICPQVWDRDKRFFVPEVSSFLKGIFPRGTCSFLSLQCGLKLASCLHFSYGRWLCSNRSSCSLSTANTVAEHAGCAQCLGW